MIVGSRGLAGFLEEALSRGARRPRGGASLGLLPGAACGDAVLDGGAVGVGGPSLESLGRGGDPAGRFPGMGPGWGGGRRRRGAAPRSTPWERLHLDLPARTWS